MISTDFILHRSGAVGHYWFVVKRDGRVDLGGGQWRNDTHSYHIQYHICMQVRFRQLSGVFGENS